MICVSCELPKEISDFYFRKDSGNYRKECKDCFGKKHKKYNAEYKKSGKYKGWKRVYDSKYHKESEVYKKYYKDYYKDYKGKPKTIEQQFVNNLRKYWPGLPTKELRSKYNLMIEAQRNRCAICDKPETRTQNGKTRNLSIDHCHKTGTVRGLLCFKCNLAIGQFGDDIEHLMASIKYLERYKVLL